VSKESAYLTVRNALIVTVIALAFNPISLIVGYYLSKSLSKPKIKIEFVHATVEYNTIVLNKDLVTNIISYKDAFNKIKAYHFFGQTTQPSDFFNSIIELTSFLKDNQISIEFIKTAIDYKTTLFSEYDSKIQLIQDNLNALSEQIVFDRSVLKKIPDFNMQSVEDAGVNGPKDASNILQQWLKTLTKEKMDLEKILVELENSLESGKERSGEVSFNVGLLNNGDTDGVVYPEAELLIGGRNLKLIRDPDLYGVIDPHSFAKYVLRIKQEDVPKKDLDYLNSLIKNSIPEDYRLVIKTPNKELSINNQLPVN
jgi:hypothetical protein